MTGQTTDTTMDLPALPRIPAKGLLLIGDPHIADTPPGQRLHGYREQILDKLRSALAMARERDLAPVFLGDLFHWPRDNSNELLVELITLLRPHRPWVLVGNHDKYQARFTNDVSMAVLNEAGAVRLMAEAGPQWILQAPQGEALICAVPDGARLPKQFDRPADCPETVVFLSHHNIRFPEFQDRAAGIREIPGVDWLINGHIHRPQEQQTAGTTTWANPGNITRLTFTRRSRERIPRVHVWRPGAEALEPLDLPHLPFSAVFPDQEFPPEAEEADGESRFIQGLERLAWRRTHEGVGLQQFLRDNLSDDEPEAGLIWALYKEVVDGGPDQ